MTRRANTRARGRGGGGVIIPAVVIRCCTHGGFFFFPGALISRSEDDGLARWSNSLRAGDDVAEVSSPPSAGELLHPDVDQLGLHLHVWLVWRLRLLDLRVHLGLGPPRRGASFPGGLHLLRDADLALPRLAADVLHPNHLAGLGRIVEGLRVEVVEELGEEDSVLFEARDFSG